MKLWITQLIKRDLTSQKVEISMTSGKTVIHRARWIKSYTIKEVLVDKSWKSLIQRLARLLKNDAPFARPVYIKSKKEHYLIAAKKYIRFPAGSGRSDFV